MNKGVELLGFNLEERIRGKKAASSPIPKNNDDGTVMISGAGFFSTGIDLELNFKNIADLINKYRQIALDPLVDASMNEMIASDLTEMPVKIDLSKSQIPDNIKTAIREEFDYICKLLKFEKNCHSITRKWYVDGILYYQKIVDPKNLKKGIQELRNIDPIHIKPIKQKIKDDQILSENDKKFVNENYLEYYIYIKSSSNNNNNYSPSPHAGSALKFTKDSITSIPSGVVDYTKKINVSYLNKAIKPINQLRMLEDSIVIYALTRATEKRIFYIDVGNLPKIKAEQYLKEVVNRYKNKISYDSVTGEVANKRHQATMLEDFFLPRRSSGNGTEISTLPAGQNLGDLGENLKFFLKKALHALNVPESRQSGDSGSFNIGRGSEIARDEIKFAKFVGRLRKQFSQLFLDPLKTQLVLKGILNVDEWDAIESDIQIDFIFDNHYAELVASELAVDRLNILAQTEPYLGNYFSKQYIQKNVLKMNDREIEEIALQIQMEKNLGLIPDPAQMTQIAAQTPAPPQNTAK
jgi:hypothetical protein